MKSRRTCRARLTRKPALSASRSLGLVRLPGQRKVMLIDADMPAPEPHCGQGHRLHSRIARAHLHRQSGQALPEMLVATGLFMLFWVAADHLARTRMAGLEAAQVSRRWAFAQAQGARPPKADGVLWLSSGGPSPRQADEVGADVQGRQLAADWLALAPTWSTIRAQLGAAGERQPFGLVRQTVVASGAGQAADAATTQQRLVGSALGWSHVAEVSQRQTQAAGAALRAVDHPWGARQPQTNWAAPWADVTPRLAPRRSR